MRFGRSFHKNAHSKTYLHDSEILPSKGVYNHCVSLFLVLLTLTFHRIFKSCFSGLKIWWSSLKGQFIAAALGCKCTWGLYWAPLNLFVIGSKFARLKHEDCTTYVLLMQIHWLEYFVADQSFSRPRNQCLQVNSRCNQGKSPRARIQRSNLTQQLLRRQDQVQWLLYTSETLLQPFTSLDKHYNFNAKLLYKPRHEPCVLALIKVELHGVDVR